MPLDANGCVSTLMNVTFYAKMLIESDRSVNECRLNKMNVFLRFTSFRFALMIVNFLVMNSRRCNSPIQDAAKSEFEASQEILFGLTTNKTDLFEDISKNLMRALLAS